MVNDFAVMGKPAPGDIYKSWHQLMCTLEFM